MTLATIQRAPLLVNTSPTLTLVAVLLMPNVVSSDAKRRIVIRSANMTPLFRSPLTRWLVLKAVRAEEGAMSLVTPYSRPDQFARRSISCRPFISRRVSSSGGRFARTPHEHNTDGYERHPDDLMGVNSMSSRKVEQDPVPAIWTECNDGSAEEDRDSSCNTGHDWRTLDGPPMQVARASTR